MNLAEALEQIVPTPPEHRTWLSRAATLQELNCTDDELDRLTEGGLATRDGEAYETFDVWNLALVGASTRSRLGREMIFFNRMLKSYRADWISPRRYLVTARVQCPRGADCSASGWASPELPGVEWTEACVEGGHAEWRGSIELRGRIGELRDPRTRQAWDALLARYRFQFTPRGLAADVDQTVARRVGDCEALSRVLVRDLQRTGVPAVLRVGYLLGGLQLRSHYWVEIDDDAGGWGALDPSMALLAPHYFTPEYQAFCFGSRLNRIVELDNSDGLYARHPCTTEHPGIEYAFELRPASSARRSVLPAAGNSGP